MKPSILFFSALACVLAPCLHAGQRAVQGVDKTAAEVRVRYADGVLVLRPLSYNNAAEAGYADFDSFTYRYDSPATPAP